MKNFKAIEFWFKADDIKSKKDEQTNLEREIARLETERKHITEKLRTTKQNLASDECIINQASFGKNFETALNEITKKVQELQVTFTFCYNINKSHLSNIWLVLVGALQ